MAHIFPGNFSFQTALMGQSLPRRTGSKKDDFCLLWFTSSFTLHIDCMKQTNKKLYFERILNNQKNISLGETNRIAQILKCGKIRGKSFIFRD